jgi:hypothetical protein
LPGFYKRRLSRLPSGRQAYLSISECRLSRLQATSSFAGKEEARNLGQKLQLLVKLLLRFTTGRHER